MSDPFLPLEDRPATRVCEEGGSTDECFSDIGNTSGEADRGGG